MTLTPKQAFDAGAEVAQLLSIGGARHEPTASESAMLRARAEAFAEAINARRALGLSPDMGKYRAAARAADDATQAAAYTLARVYLGAEWLRVVPEAP